MPSCQSYTARRATKEGRLPSQAPSPKIIVKHYKSENNCVFLFNRYDTELACNVVQVEVIRTGWYDDVFATHRTIVSIANGEALFAGSPAYLPVVVGTELQFGIAVYRGAYIPVVRCFCHLCKVYITAPAVESADERNICVLSSRCYSTPLVGQVVLQ